MRFTISITTNADTEEEVTVLRKKLERAEAALADLSAELRKNNEVLASTTGLLVAARNEQS